MLHPVDKQHRIALEIYTHRVAGRFQTYDDLVRSLSQNISTASSEEVKPA